jgi:hypothetical protein
LERFEGIRQRAAGRSDRAEQRVKADREAHRLGLRPLGVRRRATQPAVHCARRQGQLSGDRPVPAPVGLGQKHAEDDVCRVRPPGRDMR